MTPNINSLKRISPRDKSGQIAALECIFSQADPKSSELLSILAQRLISYFIALPLGDEKHREQLGKIFNKHIEPVMETVDLLQKHYKGLLTSQKHKGISKISNEEAGNYLILFAHTYYLYKAGKANIDETHAELCKLNYIHKPNKHDLSVEDTLNIIYGLNETEVALEDLAYQRFKKTLSKRGSSSLDSETFSKQLDTHTLQNTKLKGNLTAILELSISDPLNGAQSKGFAICCMIVLGKRGYKFNLKKIQHRLARIRQTGSLFESNQAYLTWNAPQKLLTKLGGSQLSKPLDCTLWAWAPPRPKKTITPKSPKLPSKSPQKTNFMI